MGIDRVDLDQPPQVFQTVDGIEFVKRRQARGNHRGDGRRQVQVVDDAMSSYAGDGAEVD